jgi:hypothetical protein
MSATIVPTPNPSSAAWSKYLDNQSFNLTGLNGSPVTFTLPEFNSWIRSIASLTSLVGFTIGATGITTIVLLIYIDPKKVRKPLFIVNLLAVTLQCLRGIENLIELNTFYISGLGQTFLNAKAQYSVAQNVAANVVFSLMSPFFYALVLVSLVLQIRVIFVAQPTIQRILTYVLSLMAVFITGCWTAYQVEYIKSIFAPSTTSLSPKVSPWLYNTTEGGVIAFVGLCCLLLVIKLFLAICWRYMCC